MLDLKNIWFRYHKNQDWVFQQLNLRIKEKAITAILGPNGAGKTTLLNILLGWLKPQTGAIKIKEMLIDQFSRKEIGQIMAYVPQFERLQFPYTVMDYALFGRAPFLSALATPEDIDYQIALKIFEVLKIEHLAHRKITSLSGGEHQLTTIARSLIQQPDILLFDEPTSQLDLGNKIRILKVMKELKQQGVTLIFTTHDPLIANQVADEVILFNNNNIQQGKPEDIFTSEILSQTYHCEVKVDLLDNRKVILLDL
ncbi:MAG: ABC transporter ATP-binding protein [Spirochaetes bacterium]|nr:ABC transporter ATP-binding protein [Spirochaetota bacterium]